MMLARCKKVLSVFSILILSFSVGCSQTQDSSNEFYGEDIHYFLGLQALKDGDSEKAQKSFVRCSQKGSFYPARRSLEQLSLMGNIQEKTKLCSEYVQRYDDDEARIFACREFVKDAEYALALEATDGIDPAEAPNELVRLRLGAMEKKNDSRLEKTINEWFTKRRISSEHYDFYKTLSEPSEILKFRIEVYCGNYARAFEMLPQILALTDGVPLTYFLTADMGRACVNGSRDNVSNAKIFEEISEDEKKSGPGIKYYSLIYSGLLYNKNDNYRRRALNQFEKAMGFAGTEEEYDQALWYYLQACLKISIDEAVEGLRKYCATWHSPVYFDDFFDSLSVLLFSGGKWNSFGEIYSVIKDYASPATVSKFAYLWGRMIQKGFAEGSDAEIEEAWKAAVNCDTGSYVYYKLLAAKHSGLSLEQIEKIFFNSESQKAAEQPDEEALSARKLLLGYAEFGFAEKIYEEWQAFFEKDSRMIDPGTVEKLALFLRNLDNGENGFYSKSLRMTAKTANLEGNAVSRKAFELLYPRNFDKEVDAACAEFEVEDYVMYALIRTESFFEPQIKSRAGACGLTQLMESTAADCAARLKVENYVLTDPAVNVRFGTYYFSNLASRLDDSKILALFAYNAGITNVRRWVRGSKIQLEASGRISSDLFLETLPFGETRDYGRRVISAAAMYAWLYYGINPCDVVEMMM